MLKAPMGAEQPNAWRAYAVRRRGVRTGLSRYELCLALGSELHIWQLEGVLPRDPRAPREARYIEAESASALWFEGAGSDGEPCLVWDAGRYRCEGDFADGLSRGKLRVEFVGHKLAGAWALGRRKGTSRGRGKAPIISDAWDVIVVPTSEVSTLAQPRPSVLTGLDLDDLGGESRSTGAQKHLAKLSAPRASVPWKRERVLLEPASVEPFSDPEWLFELRRDGAPVIASRYRGRGHLIDANGAEIGGLFPEITRALEAQPLSPLIVEGELVVGDAAPVDELEHRLALSDANEIASAALLYPATLWVFDLLGVMGRDTRALELEVRKELLAQLFATTGFIRYVDYLPERGEALFKQLACGPATNARIVARERYAPYSAENGGVDRVIESDRGEADRAAPTRAARPAIRTSNRGKVFFPKAGLTKGDLLDYYEAIAPTLLRHLADRPLVLTRFPDGIDGRSFFQHHAPGAQSAWLRTARLKTSKRWRDYFICEATEDLLYLANLGTIELHGWPSRATSIEQPDWCTLDIDRSEATFATVAAIANHARDLCDSIGLPTLVKTSGGEGLHVVIPLGGQLDYDGARILVELLARTLASEHNALATIEGLIAERDGKVYLDYLVNARGRMLVVPYSARARPGAPVSTPLSWDEVTPSLDPHTLNITTIPSRVKERGDLWSSLLTERADVPAALERLSGRLKA